MSSGPLVGIWHPGLSSNYGDRAIQRASVDLVLSHWPDARIVQYHRNPPERSTVYPGPRFSFRGLGVLGLPPRGKQFADLDVLLWGGGSLIQQSSMLHFPVHLFAAVSAARSGVKVLCFGTGVEPMRSRLLRELCRRAFDGDVFEDGFVRGPHSAQLLRSFGVQRAVRVAVDQAASLSMGDRRRAQYELERLFGWVDDGPYVSISVKPPFLYRGGWLPVSFDPVSPLRLSRHRKRREFEASFGMLARHLVRRGAKVVLVPMYAGQGDLAACRRVADLAGNTKRIRILAQPLEPRQLKAMLSLMSVHVGVRLHSCILATSAGVPTLAVGYMLKHRDYFTQLGMEDWLVPEGEVTGGLLIERFDSLWSARESIGKVLVERNGLLVAELERAVASMFSRLDDEWLT